jgi:hypothetical protein
LSVARDEFPAADRLTPTPPGNPQLATRNSHRELLVSGAFAVWGLAIAIALITFWTRPAPAGQLPGAASALDFDAHGPFRWIAGLMLLPLLVPLALKPLSRRLAAGREWAGNSVVAAALVTLWFVTSDRKVGWSIVPCALVIAICTLLRRRELRFTRADAVLFPAFLTTLLGLIDIGGVSVNAAVLVAALLVFTVRVAIAFIPSPTAPAYAFAAAPLALILQTGFFARDQRYFGWPAVAIVVLTPFLMRAFVRVPEARLRRLLVLCVYPLALYAYTNAMSRETAEGKPRVNFFEDGHALLPASEYLAGERPYRDTLPAHGLLEDGGLDALAMKLGGVNVGTRLRARLVVGNLVSMALYALAFAATGSAEGALFAVMLGVMTGAYTTAFRLLAPILTLALIAAAARMRRPRLLFWAGVGAVVSAIVSLDFGAFTVLVLMVAVVRTGRRKAGGPAGGKPALLGLLTAAGLFFAGLAAFGILGDFLRSTFVETVGVAPAYTLEMFAAPALMKSANAFPDVLAVALHRDVFLYIAWCAIAVVTGVMIARRPRRRHEAVLLLGVWTVVSAISYAERHHLRFGVIAAVIFVFVILQLLRRRSALAIPAIVAAIALAAPTTHLAVVGWMRQSRGPTEPDWVEIGDLPRARGALFHERDARVVESVRKVLSLSLKPDETFFDFTNSGILYFLTRRDCPIREYEVAFYETEAGQREIIRRIEASPKVRAALVSTAPRFTVDGIPNATRAPLVWQYLQDHFEPDFEEGDVVMWRRK